MAREVPLPNNPRTKLMGEYSTERSEIVIVLVEYLFAEEQRTLVDEKLTCEE